MDDKEFLCSMYNKDLVDRAIEESKELYKEHDAEMLYKMAKTTEMLPDRTGGAEIYDTIQRQMRYAYLHGACYAVSKGLTSNDTKPSEQVFSDFHKNVDFAVLFNFADNDFCLAIEAGAKTYCDVFNKMLHQIDMYADEDLVKNRDIQQFEELCNIANIKEVMKCGFLAYRISKCAEVGCSRTPNAAYAVAALKDSKSDLECIPWDRQDVSLWETVDGKYVEVDKIPRFVTGTRAEIEEALKKHGEPFVNQNEEFPVWCNGEVLILYMKNGYLTYLIR